MLLYLVKLKYDNYCTCTIITVIQCCTLLAKQLGANIDVVNVNGHTAVMLSAMYEHHDTVKSLLK